MGSEQEASFQELKQQLASAPVLAYFDKEALTRVIADAIPVGLVAVLVQVKNGEGRAVCCSLSQELYISVFELPFWIITSSSTNFFGIVLCIKASACKITPAITKDGTIENFPTQRPFEGFLFKQPQQYSNPTPHTLAIYIYK